MTVSDALRRLCTRPSCYPQWNSENRRSSARPCGESFFSSDSHRGVARGNTAQWQPSSSIGPRPPACSSYGAIARAFRDAEPEWKAGIAVMVLLPLASHSIELGVHLLRGTPHLGSSLAAIGVLDGDFGAIQFMQRCGSWSPDAADDKASSWWRGSCLGRTAS